MNRQDRQGARTTSDLEYRYQFGKSFAEIMGVATDARNLASEAQSLYKGLSHEQIFNLLTNNGELEGLYEENGEVYINASYIKTGELSANLIKTGVIKSSNYAELTDGTVYLGMAIDLDNGIINTPKFKLDDFGNITATGGMLGGFDISDEGMTKSWLQDYQDGTVQYGVSIRPTEIKTTMTTYDYEQNTSTTDSASISAGHLYIENQHSGTNFIGGLAWYKENRAVYSIYIDPDTQTVKARLFHYE